MMIHLLLHFIVPAVIVAICLPFTLLSFGNAIRFALVDFVFVCSLTLLMISVNKWRSRRSIQSAVVALVLTLSLAISVIWRIPMPLQERAAGFPASAGLRASAWDRGH